MTEYTDDDVARRRPTVASDRPSITDRIADAWDLADAGLGYGTPVEAVVAQLLNPPDGDGSYESILSDAIGRAVGFIEAQPCTCDAPDGDVCDRCLALGRFSDVELDR